MTIQTNNRNEENECRMKKRVKDANVEPAAIRTATWQAVMSRGKSFIRLTLLSLSISCHTRENLAQACNQNNTLPPSLEPTEGGRQDRQPRVCVWCVCVCVCGWGGGCNLQMKFRQRGKIGWWRSAWKELKRKKNSSMGYHCVWERAYMHRTTIIFMFNHVHVSNKYIHIYI